MKTQLWSVGCFVVLLWFSYRFVVVLWMVLKTTESSLFTLK